MVDLHFKSSGKRPKCIHVYARDKQDLKYYLRFVYQNGDQLNHQVKKLKQGYSDYAGTGTIVPKEANSTLQQMGLIDSGELTSYGEFLGSTLENGRSDIFEDCMIQHMRAFPTMAYVLDIVKEADGEIVTGEVTEILRNSSDTESTFEENSIRNCLNLVSDFNTIRYHDNLATYKPRDRTTLEAAQYAILLLAGDNQSVDAPDLRGSLPTLLHCTPDGTEEMVDRARRQFQLFTYRSRGDPNRMQTFAGIFEVEVEDTSPEDLAHHLL